MVPIIAMLAGFLLLGLLVREFDRRARVLLMLIVVCGVFAIYH